MSYNIRGGGFSVKRKRVSSFIQQHKIDVCFIQETKTECFSDSLAREFWGSKEVDWSAGNSIGASGGMVILWGKGAVSVNFSFRGKGFVGINIEWKGKIYNLINVYAPCNRKDRGLVWLELLALKNRRGPEDWCIVGDFNEVLNGEERLDVSSNRDRLGMEEFAGFVENMDLVDVNCVGGGDSLGLKTMGRP
ncbi:uncharacterized protein LOC131621305 [Vicia villosa]|uniref:uncharacterized protein LOC131621305 n=1 Tax=Vicia villosa TaxID=3911 RepID=UPI00273BD660|nr:uncharacterized protein LOC131621305 [Vicia villosa]